MGLTEQIEEMNKKLEEITEGKKKKEKEKTFKFPFGKKVGKSQAKKNYVTIIGITENGALSFKKEQIKQQTTMVDGVPRLAQNEHVLFHKGRPCIIQPSWSVEPFSPKQHFAESLLNGSNVVGYPLLLHRMKTSAADGNKKKVSGMVGIIIGGIVLAIIGYAFFTGGI